MHIGITGPIYLPSINLGYKGDRTNWPRGMGGVPVNHLINALLELGYQLSVFSSSPEIEIGESFEWHEENISIYIGPYRKRAKLQVFDFFAVEREYIKNIILKVKPDIVHAHWQYEWAWGAIDSGIPTLVSCHDSPVHVFKSQPDVYRLFRLVFAFIVLKKAIFLTTVSDSCKKGLKLITLKKIAVIPNFEPDKVFDLYSPRTITDNSIIRVVMVNNGFTNLKNVSIGIFAFKSFRDRFPSAELHLFGKSFGIGEEANLWAINKSCSENVFFHGQLNFDRLIREMSAMDVFLHTSKQESFGMALVEAMAMGMPVIAGNNSGGPEWILKNGGGMLVDITNAIAVKNALVDIIEPAIYTKTSLLAREIAVNRFSKDKVVKGYIEIYELITHKK
ncbi:glycosyltransferase family 4 protein [Flavobacterium sp. Arc2]|uniref:glycosyltransferase family 4 protein n=1 Tax=Flavobacterium sp. Arc2 TaxID=3046685 RepID=UPI00352C2378